jgi:hypothetical protein
LKTRGPVRNDNSKMPILHLSDILEPLVFPCPDM